MTEARRLAHRLFEDRQQWLFELIPNGAGKIGAK
jgi:hypothetical protein